MRVDPATGIEGDRWAQDEHSRPGNQVSMINVHVLNSLAARPEDSVLSGDNLQVDLDLTEKNLPPGTLLTIGDAVLEVSSDPHRPCAKFLDRFGASGAKKVARANRTGHRGRGVLLRIVRAGTVSVGDAIYVKRPGSACLS